MKKFLKKALVLFTKAISLVYPYSLSVKARGYKNLIYTYWLKCFIGEIGDSTIVEKPCLLMGGGHKKINIGSHTIIQSHSVLGCYDNYRGKSYNPSIVIGDNSSIGEYNHFTVINHLKIGDGLLTGRFVIISDNNHGGMSKEEAIQTPLERELKSKGGISIGNNCWIGDKASILGGVHIGDNVIIAANSVVTHDVPNNCIVAGVPAKIISQL